MPALTLFLVTAVVALVAHQVFRVVWTSLPRWGVSRTGRIALVAGLLVLAVVAVPKRDAGVLGFVVGGVVLPMLLTKRRPVRS